MFLTDCSSFVTDKLSRVFSGFMCAVFYVYLKKNYCMSQKIFWNVLVMRSDYLSTLNALFKNELKLWSCTRPS